MADARVEQRHRDEAKRIRPCPWGPMPDGSACPCEACRNQIDIAQALANADQRGRIEGAEQWRERFAEAIRALRELVGAEWMVSHDWGGDRASVVCRANGVLSTPEAKEVP